MVASSPRRRGGMDAQKRGSKEKVKDEKRSINVQLTKNGAIKKTQRDTLRKTLNGKQLEKPDDEQRNKIGSKETDVKEKQEAEEAADKGAPQTGSKEKLKSKNLETKEKQQRNVSKESKEPRAKVKDATRESKDAQEGKDEKEAKKNDTAGKQTTSENREPAPPPTKRIVFLLKEGQMLLNKFKVEGLLADGGFAQVYAAVHEDSQTRWAVKIESEKCDRKRMKLEIMVLMLLRGKANIPEIMAMGTCPTGHFIILELVGRNLSDLRRQLPHKRLTPGTLYRSMLQVTQALSLVHGAGFLHRDLKPSNCCVGVDDVTRIYLLDYGLTRQYLDSAGQIRKPRPSIGMRGTLRYVSLEAHARHDLGPSHDLVALLYSTIELGDGHLPWSKMREEAAIKASKQETTIEKLCEKQPKMLKLAEYIYSMKYETMPDYDKVLKMLKACHPPDVKANDPYDWQATRCQLEHFIKKDKGEGQGALEVDKVAITTEEDEQLQAGQPEVKKDTHDDRASMASDMDKNAWQAKISTR